MKLTVIFIFSLSILTKTCFGWPRPFSFWSGSGRSLRIPGFILDIEHPWLKDKRNLFQLGLLDDPRSALCDLSSELRPSNTSHSFTYPVDLFKSLTVPRRSMDDFEYDIDGQTLMYSPKDAEYILQRINDTLHCPAALHDVEELTVMIDISINQGHGNVKWPGPPVSTAIEIASSLAELMASMPHLRKLVTSSSHDMDSVLERVFTKANVTLPTIRELSVSSDTKFLAGISPALESLEYQQSMRWSSPENQTNSTLKLLKLLDFAPKLRHFSMRAEWKVAYVKTLFETKPNLTDLTIQNQYWMSFAMAELYDEDPRGRGSKLKRFVDALAGFQDLRRLSLPDISELGLGYDGGPWCGNAYFGREGRAYGRTVTRQMVEATERASEIVLAKLPKLDSLSMGHSSLNITTDEDGKVVAIWPWTGRLTEYLYEKWPERESWRGEDAEYDSYRKHPQYVGWGAMFRGMF